MAGEFAFSISLTFAMLFLAWCSGDAHRPSTGPRAVLFGAHDPQPPDPGDLRRRRRDRDRPGAARGPHALVGCEPRPQADGRRAVALVVVELLVVAGGFPCSPRSSPSCCWSFDAAAFRYLAVVAPGRVPAGRVLVRAVLSEQRVPQRHGWEKYTNYADYLWPQTEQFDMANRNLWFVLAGVGIVLSLVHRVRLGWFLTMTLVAFAWLFVFLPQYRLWNARLLPFYFLCIFLLADARAWHW